MTRRSHSRKYRSFAIVLTAVLMLLCSVLPAAAMEEAITQLQTELSAEDTLPATCSESALGDLLADAVLDISAALSSEYGEKLVILPAQCMTDKLEKGSVFASDLERIMPEDAPLVSVRMSPAQLRALLEIGVSHLTRDDSERIDTELSAWDGFPQVAGFQWEYDVSAPVGERVQYITVNGEELDLADTEARFTVISVAALFDGSLGYEVYQSAKETGLSLRQTVRLYCMGAETLSEPESRSTAIGTASYPLMDRFPVLAIVGICIIVALVAAVPRLKEKKYYSFEGK